MVPKGRETYDRQIAMLALGNVKDIRKIPDIMVYESMTIGNHELCVRFSCDGSEEYKMSTTFVRVQEKGQVTLPLEIRRKLKLKKGDLVTFVETEDGILIKPAEVVAVEMLDEIGRVLKERNISLEELLAKSRDIRGKLIEEEYSLDKSKPE
jgi:AbrB family looped-hinge helix DNA binding protein